jgi:hypothetical protein
LSIIYSQLFDRESVRSVAEVLLTGLQHGTCPLGMVGAIGILLTLQTYADVLRILQTVLADDVGIFANTLEVT